MRDSGLKTYHMKLRVVTPTFIGGGNDTNINKSQYIFDPVKKKLKIIDERKLADFLSKRKLLDIYLSYVRELNSRHTRPGRNPNRNDFNLAQWYENITKKFRVQGSLDECVKYTIDVSNIQKNQLNDIHCFIKDISGKPYIPGSSIKGSIVNAIMTHRIYHNRGKYLGYWKEIKEVLKALRIDFKQLNRIYTNLIKDVLDYSVTDSRGKRFELRGMSGLSVSDTSTFDRDKMKLFQRADLLLTEKGRNTLPTFRECLVSPAEAEFTLRLDSYKLKPDLQLKSIEQVFEALRTQYELLVGKDGIFRVFPELDAYLPNSEDETGYLFIGAGTGYLTKTIMAALAPGKDELRQVVRKILHKDQPPTFRHKNDKVISPRTLKFSENNNKNYFNGICRIGVI